MKFSRLKEVIFLSVVALFITKEIIINRSVTSGLDRHRGTINEVETANKSDASDSEHPKRIEDDFCNGPDVPAFAPLNMSGAHPLKRIPDYKISVCHNPKSGSMAVARAVSHLAYLNDTEFGQKIRTPQYMKTHGFNYFYHMNDLPNPPMSALTIESDWTNIFVVRNPVTRVISAFADMCLRYHICLDWEKDDFTVFIINLYQALIDKQTKAKIHQNINFDRLYHFFPQTWFCSGHMTEATFPSFRIVKQDKPSFIDDFSNILKSGGIEADKLVEFKEVMKYKSHSTSSMLKEDRIRLEKKIRSNPIIWKCLMKIVRKNAEMLNYEIEQPKFD